AEPDLVAMFGADHVYRMDLRQMIDSHVQRKADATVSAIPVPREMASEFGVIETAGDGAITGFHEKKLDAPTLPGDPSRVFASMGNYIFSASVLLRELYADAENPGSSHDFGRDILPSMVGRAGLYAYDFQSNHIPGDPAGQPAYWRDVGTIDAYYEANMDLRAVLPALNLYNRSWPLRTAGYSDAPAKFTFDDEGRRGYAIDSIVSGGSILSGGQVRNSVLGRNVRIHTGASVEDSVIFDNCDIGRHAKVRRAILGKNVHVPAGGRIGYDLVNDRELYYVTGGSDIVVVEGHRSPVDVAGLHVG
ncbi:MAG: sugar phosphate nucleotidyltransferase, partial [Pseudomonadota bacterium]